MADPETARIRKSNPGSGGFWVFGYGSLMWRPGFPFTETVPAWLPGAHRALCVYSWVHRGTEREPGLVLGLDRGGSCRGLAFRVAEENGESVISYLRERELVTSVYREARRPIRLGRPDGPETPAVAFLVDRRHPQYAGVLPLEVQLALVRHAVGRSGTNRDYVINTVAHLRQLNIRDADLEWLAERLGPDQAAAPPTSGGDLLPMRREVVEHSPTLGMSSGEQMDESDQPASGGKLGG